MKNTVVRCATPSKQWLKSIFKSKTVVVSQWMTEINTTDYSIFNFWVVLIGHSDTYWCEILFWSKYGQFSHLLHQNHDWKGFLSQKLLINFHKWPKEKQICKIIMSVCAFSLATVTPIGVNSCLGQNIGFFPHVLHRKHDWKVFFSKTLV